MRANPLRFAAYCARMISLPISGTVGFDHPHPWSLAPGPRSRSLAPRAFGWGMLFDGGVQLRQQAFHLPLHSIILGNDKHSGGAGRNKLYNSSAPAASQLSGATVDVNNSTNNSGSSQVLSCSPSVEAKSVISYTLVNCIPWIAPGVEITIASQ